MNALLRLPIFSKLMKELISKARDLTNLAQCSISIPPENLRKPLPCVPKFSGVIEMEDCLNSFHATGIFQYPLKTSENLWFSDVFRGYWKRPMAWNGLNGLKARISTNCSSRMMLNHYDEEQNLIALPALTKQQVAAINFSLRKIFTKLLL